MLLYLSEYYSGMDQRDSARSLSRQALELAPDDPKVLVRLAGVHEHLGERDKALNSLERAVRLGYPVSAIAANSEFQTMHADQRFRNLLEESTTVHESDSSKRE